MNKACILDGKRSCNNSCIAYEPGGGCRAGSSSGHKKHHESDDLGLKEV